MAEIRLENLTKIFDQQTVAVDDVNFSFESNVLTCLLGPSGCGKTTLLRMIAGLEQPTRGDVYFDDRQVTDFRPGERNIGMVFQQPVVYPGLNVGENIEMPLKEQEMSAGERRKKVDEMVELLGLTEARDRPVRSLDIGGRQKVSVARTLARNTDIILFDEPITNVDIETEIQLKKSLKEFSRQLERTIVYVTHDQTTAMTLADNIALMRDGSIVQSAAPRELYHNPTERFGGWFLGNPGMNFFEPRVETRDGQSILSSPLLSRSLSVPDEEGVDLGPDRSPLIGIRPEHVRCSTEPEEHYVEAQVQRKSVYVGGQYLVNLTIQDHLIKSKVDPDLGQRIGDRIWFSFPVKHIRLFNQEGVRLNVSLDEKEPMATPEHD